MSVLLVFDSTICSQHLACIVCPNLGLTLILLEEGTYGLGRHNLIHSPAISCAVCGSTVCFAKVWDHGIPPGRLQICIFVQSS